MTKFRVCNYAHLIPSFFWAEGFTGQWTMSWYQVSYTFLAELHGLNTVDGTSRPEIQVTIIHSSWENPTCQRKVVTDIITDAATDSGAADDDQVFDTSCLKISIILYVNAIDFVHPIGSYVRNKIYVQYCLRKNFYCTKFRV